MKPIQLLRLTAAIILAVCLTAGSSFAAEEPSLTDQAKQAGEDTKETVAEAVEDATVAVRDASRSAGEAIDDLWKSIDEQRLKNRTPDQIVAWAIMGVLVGAVAGMATSLKATGLGKVGRLLLGLTGAFVGGIVVHVAQLDFGWGPVLIRYEDLLFSLLGALLLIVIGRVVRSKSKQQAH